MAAKLVKPKAREPKPSAKALRASVDPGNDPARRQACIDLAESDEPMMFADGHDDAIIGIADIQGENVVAYDAKKIIRQLRRRDGMSTRDAAEFFNYNIVGACGGNGFPVFLLLLPK